MMSDSTMGKIITWPKSLERIETTMEKKAVLKATQDCLIVRPDMEKHDLFILLRKKHTGTGVVISAGPDAVDVKVGDRVVFGDNIGQDLRWEGEDLLVMREEHTFGVIEE